MLATLRETRAPTALAEVAGRVVAVANAPAAPASKVQQLLEHVLNAPAESVGPLTRAQAVELALRWFPNGPTLLTKCAELAFRAGDFALCYLCRPAATSGCPLCRRCTKTAGNAGMDRRCAP